MRHPEDLLADLVDGSLSPRERRVLDAHLAICARCSDEVALAASARSTLASLVEVPAPVGLAASAIREATGARAPRRSAGAPRWYRFAGVAAAAAAALLIATLVLPRIGGGGSSSSTEAKGNGAAASLPGAFATSRVAVPLEVQHTNYDDASLSALAASFASPAPSGAAGADSPAAAPLQAPAQLTQRALACITKSATQERGQLTRLIQAKFHGVPAFIAAFLEGPGANQPPDSVTIWVFSTKGCAILSSSFARL